MKRWIIPILFAVILHSAVFWLDLFPTRPVMAMRENRSVTISLQAISAPAPEPFKARIPAALAPLTSKPIPLRPMHKAAVAPAPQPALTEKPPMPPAPVIDETPLPQEAAQADAPMPSDDQAMIDDRATQAQTVDESPFGPDQAQVTASVPLYHLNPPPSYPAVARRRNYQGTVLLAILVDRHGRAAQVKLAQSSGYEILDNSAMRSVRQWRFEPARRMGQAIEKWVQVPVQFVLN